MFSHEKDSHRWISGWIVLFFTMVSLSVGADPPEYDATGTWNYQATEGWSDCSRSVNPDTSGTFTIVQSGNSFTAYGNTQGSVVGSRYRFIGGVYTAEWASTQSMVWSLTSSSTGNGYFEMDTIDDESSVCTVTYDLHLQKQGDCTPTDTKMCLQNGRFLVSVDWENEHRNSGVGHAIPSTDDSGLFWFFGPNNMELLIKVLDGCSINNRYWVFFAATTDQKFTVTVTDLQTSQQVEYTNPLKNPADAVTDTDAFATCP
jgi:hypothetical protein